MGMQMIPFVFFVSQRLDRGPDFGYLPQPSNTILVVGPIDSMA